VPAVGGEPVGFERRASRTGFATEWLKEDRAQTVCKQECPPWSHHNQGGSYEPVDDRNRPPQGVAHRVAIRRGEDQLSSVKVRATNRQVDHLMSWRVNTHNRRTAPSAIASVRARLLQLSAWPTPPQATLQSIKDPPEGTHAGASTSGHLSAESSRSVVLAAPKSGVHELESEAHWRPVTIRPPIRHC